MPTLLLSVRYRVRSGKHLLAASISAFDPKRPFADRLPGAAWARYSAYAVSSMMASRFERAFTGAA
jgi:hypothetical protein